MSDGGYDSGYEKCDCFWGTTPADLVKKAIDLSPASRNSKALDIGCGEGKNSFLLARSGFSTLAFDISEKALANAMRSAEACGVSFLQASILDVSAPGEQFDIVIATGSLHCLPNEDAIIEAISKMKMATKVGGLNVLTGFNLGDHDMSGHPSSFNPTLLPHDFYLDMYSDWNIIDDSSVVQKDCHPDNNILHHHSITRLLARR